MLFRSYGYFAPTGTPRAIVNKVNADVKKVLAMPEIRDRLAGEGAEVTSSSPEEFASLIKNDMGKWARVVKQSGAHAD